MPTTVPFRKAIREHRRTAIGVASGILIAVAVTVFILLNSSKPSQAITYTNISRNFKACLLSTTHNASDAGRAWQAMQAATTQEPINAQHITAPPGQTTDLVAYFNSLVALHCQLIVTVGDDLHDALTDTATRNPQIHFLNIGAPINLANVHTTQSVDQPEITSYLLATARTTTAPTH